MGVFLSNWVTAMKWLLAIAFPFFIISPALIGIYDRLYPFGQAQRIMNYALPGSFLWCININREEDEGAYNIPTTTEKRTYLLIGRPFGITAVMVTFSDLGKASFEQSISPLIFFGALFIFSIYGTLFLSVPMLKRLIKSRHNYWRIPTPSPCRK
jgi:hypothetical protein